MIVLDLIGILVAILLAISLKRSKVSFEEWLFEYSGFSGYLIKIISLLLLIIMLYARIDWTFLETKI
jgi:hypothetical protein